MVRCCYPKAPTSCVYQEAVSPLLAIIKPEDLETGRALLTVLRDALSSGAGASPEHTALLRAIAKAGLNRDKAVKNVCRLYQVRDLDQLPAHIKSALRELLP